ncbi:hypothetical protein [Alicyclobacillus kakegawensis]|uniref:hypothetical protein n=1 Tax=Alicyclobacillus kakegawensis TaxID=392012 RepID=UPI00082F6977|nr:hypothetical protein [Alicyclobacillus kakegawensis]
MSERELRLRPAEMRPETLKKAKEMMQILYMHQRLTVDQLRALIGIGSLNTVTRILDRTGYVGRRHRSGILLYRGGRWRQTHRIDVLHLNAHGIAEMEELLGVDRWGYTDRPGDMVPNNLVRCLQMADAVVAARMAGGTDLQWESVLYWLGRQRAWEPARESDDQSIRELKSVWEHRPTAAGFLRRRDGKDLCVGLYLKTARGYLNYVHRAFPEKLLHHFDPVLFMGMKSYERFFPMAMQSLYGMYQNLMILPYEYSLDHPTWLNAALHGDNTLVMQPLFQRKQVEGWDVRELHHHQIPFRWVMFNDTETLHVDTTYGTSLGHVASLVTMPASAARGVVRRVVYVVSEGEKQTLEKWRSSRGNYAPVEFRVIDW